MNKINNLIDELKRENEVRAQKMNKTEDQYNHTVLVHQYNLTLDFIKRLERLSF